MSAAACTGMLEKGTAAPVKVGPVLGIDIGGTNMRFGMVDPRLRLTNFTIEKSAEVLDCEDPLARLVGRVTAYCGRFFGGRLPAAVSIGFPSTIDRAHRVVVSTPNIRSLQNLRVADGMEAALGIPVYIDRDVNFLFSYDMEYHKIGGQGTALGFYFGTGLGNAVSIDGKLLTGRNGMAAELGHVPVYGCTHRCGCGNTGCMETIASGIYLERLLREQFPGTPIPEAFTRHGGTPQIMAYIDNLSLPIATEVNIFDPDYVVIGGGIVQMEGFPRQALEERIHFHARKPYPEQNLRILYSCGGQENGVIGAGIAAYRRG